MTTTHCNRTYAATTHLALALALLFLFAASAFAATEGKKQQFLVRDAAGTSYGTYDTQAQAEAAIKAIPGPGYLADAYQQVDTIKNTVIRGDGTALITYWMGRTKPGRQRMKIGYIK